MSDKENEIKELKERLEKLEESNPKEQKEEETKPGCLSQILVLLVIVIGVGYFFYDDSDNSTNEESAEEVKQEAPKVDVAKKNREQIITSLAKQDFNAYWGQDTSLWIENPGYSKAELERFGYRFCDATKNAGMNQSYIITFWQSLRNGPSGQILKVNCF